MIVNKKSRLALTALALTILLPLSSAFAGDSETWRQTFNRWGSTTYPAAAQLGTFAGTTAIASLHKNALTQNAILAVGAFAANLLALYLRDRQSPEQKNSWPSRLTNPSIINALLLAFNGYSASREGGHCPTLGVMGGLLGSVFLSNMAKNFYNQWSQPSENLPIEHVQQ